MPTRRAVARRAGRRSARRTTRRTTRRVNRRRDFLLNDSLVDESPQSNPNQAGQNYQQQSGDDPLKLLKERLAKGEITPEEYENLKKILSE